MVGGGVWNPLGTAERRSWMTGGDCVGRRLVEPRGGEGGFLASSSREAVSPLPGLLKGSVLVT